MDSLNFSTTSIFSLSDMFSQYQLNPQPILKPGILNWLPTGQIQLTNPSCLTLGQFQNYIGTYRKMVFIWPHTVCLWTLFGPSWPARKYIGNHRYRLWSNCYYILQDGGDTEATEDQLGVCVLQLSQTINDLRKQVSLYVLSVVNPSKEGWRRTESIVLYIPCEFDST